MHHNHFASTTTTAPSTTQGSNSTASDIIQILVESDYLWVLLSCVWIGFQCLLHGFIYGGGGRGKTFTKEFLEQHFGEEHKKMTGGQGIAKGGYPDTGNGKYSQKLDYESWYKFNCGQRIHLNYVEGISTIIIITLVAGIFFPIYAAAIGAVYMVGRQIVAFGYLQPKGFVHGLRVGGVLLLDLAILANFILANVGIFQNLKF